MEIITLSRLFVNFSMEKILQLYNPTRIHSLFTNLKKLVEIYIKLWYIIPVHIVFSAGSGVSALCFDRKRKNFLWGELHGKNL